MNYVYCDIETDGLNPTTIWCAVCRYKGVNTVICNEKDFKEYVSAMGISRFVFHNGTGFDVPCISRLWGYAFSRDNLVDTLVLSRLANPSIPGGHSLRKWGERLGFPKGDHDDWSRLTPDMIDYCMRDTEVTQAVHEKLLEELEGFSQQSIDLEHQVAWQTCQQERNGWLLDQRKADTLLATFKERMNDIEAELQATFPPIVEERYSEKTGKRLKDRVEIFNVGSRQQVASRLSAKGAKWDLLTETGKPVVDERTLKLNDHVPETKQVLEYLTIQKRRGLVESWVEHAQEDGRVHGRVISNGAVTGRMTHQNPNMAQVPSINSEYGKECRECWIVPGGRKLVGFDASGLELRMLAHYMKDEDYVKTVTEGSSKDGTDVHTINQRAAGLETRDQAKTFIYAFLYGAGPEKIGSIVGGSRVQGQRLIDRFLKGTPSLQRLRAVVQRYAEEGYVPGLDGRKIWVRSEHAALNSLLQGAGAIVMKKALVLFDTKVTKNKWPVKMVANVHDEFQFECPPDIAEEAGKAARQSIVEAGLSYNLRCPLDGEYKIGRNWRETH